MVIARHLDHQRLGPQRAPRCRPIHGYAPPLRTEALAVVALL
jgi:hypothetical protein